MILTSFNGRILPRNVNMLSDLWSKNINYMTEAILAYEVFHSRLKYFLAVRWSLFVCLCATRQGRVEGRGQRQVGAGPRTSFVRTVTRRMKEMWGRGGLENWRDNNEREGGG